MKTKFLIGLTLSAVLVTGCSENYTRGGELSTPIADSTPEIVVPMDTISEQNHFDAATTYSSKCAGCHGANGEGKSIFPRLAGQSKVELTKKLNGYKDGSYGKDRKAMMMPSLENLNSHELEQIAEVIAKF